MNLQEIEAAFSQFRICPKCSSEEGFWLGSKHGNAYVQCKGCGAKFDLFEVYKISKSHETPERLRFFKH